MNITQRILLFTLCTLPFLCFSQEKYLQFDEVQFDTEIERNTLHSLMVDSTSLISGFFVIAPEDSLSFENWNTFFNREIETLKNRKKSKKVSKDIKFIYDQLHEKFLRKYEIMAFFDQIFEKGVYNCVTAVAIYALAFDELGIPYQIKETPTHVYIIADPDGSSLLIETTDPISGFKSFTPGFRENYVVQLGAMKLVDQNDISSKGIYKVFDEFYYGGATLSLKQLIGIQYYNKGFTLYEQKDYIGAWNALSKAQLFHDNEQLNTMLFASIANELSNSDYSDWNGIHLLPYLDRFLEFDIKRTNVLGEFQRMLSFVLVSNNNIEKAEKAFEYFMKNSKDQEVKKEISYAYYYERAVIEYNRANYSNALEFITNAYNVKPGNTDTENLMRESFRLSYSNKKSIEALHKLDSMMNNNQELLKNNHFNSMRLNLTLTVMGEKFYAKRPNEGNELKTSFEKNILENPNFNYDKNILGTAYSKAAVYYFKRGYSTRARAIIKTGLKYAPDNYELKTRMRMINSQ